MKHFGILKNKGFEAMSPAEQEALLLELGLYEVKHRIKISRNNIPVALVATNENRIVVPTKAVEEEFYGYLKGQFEQDIEDPYLEFFYVFNEEIYGLEEDEQRAIGLFYFKLYAELAKNHSVDFMRERKTDNGSSVPETWGKLESLHAQQNSLKSRVARSELLMPYLQGDQEAFNPESTNDNALLSEIVEFEGNVKILRSLNGLFSFEDDPFEQLSPCRP